MNSHRLFEKIEMKNHKADPHTKNLRKRKRRNEVADAVSVKKQNATITGIGMDKLPDDMLIAILSRMSLKEAAKTSVLSSRWRNLWKSTSRALVFDDKDTSTGAVMELQNFACMVDSTLDLHKGTGVDNLCIRFSNIRPNTRGDLDTMIVSNSVQQWIRFAMANQVKKFELDLSDGGGFHYNYKFPSFLAWLTTFPTEKWLTPTFKAKYSVSTLRSLGAFCSLRSLRLVGIDIEDHAVRYFLGSCPYMEHLCIRASHATKSLEVVDTLPNLKELEISDCCNLQNLEISATNLVSCTYVGKKISSPFKKVPSLSELTLGGEFCESFLYEPNKHSRYSSQLAKLVLNLQTVSLERKTAPLDLPQLHGLKRLELNIVSQVGRSLLFFISLIKASPHLHEFEMKIDYLVGRPSSCESMIRERLMPFPEVNTTDENMLFEHKNLKVVKMGAYCGCQSEEEFLVQLCKITSLEKVFIDTDCDYYLDHPENYVAMYRLRENGKNLMNKKTRNAEQMKNGAMTPSIAKKHAHKLRSTFFPSETKFVIT